jgi:hypothetical protein
MGQLIMVRPAESRSSTAPGPGAASKNARTGALVPADTDANEAAEDTTFGGGTPIGSPPAGTKTNELSWTHWLVSVPVPMMVKSAARKLPLAGGRDAPAWA